MGDARMPIVKSHRTDRLTGPPWPFGLSPDAQAIELRQVDHQRLNPHPPWDSRQLALSEILLIVGYRFRRRNPSTIGSSRSVPRRQGMQVVPQHYCGKNRNSKLVFPDGSRQVLRNDI